ncbi:unnamed protein product [Gordionus sp. m RMFG-2023]
MIMYAFHSRRNSLNLEKSVNDQYSDYGNYTGNICQPDYVRKNGGPTCRPRCPKGHFFLNGMTECHPWLDCSDIRIDVKFGPKIGSGNIKKVYKARWKTMALVANRGNPTFLKSYFNRGLKNLIEMQPSPHVTQYIGHCRNYLLTEFHPLGNLGNLDQILSDTLPHLNTLYTRFRICVDYATILSFLADPEKMSGGVRIMCDTSSLSKLLRQYLLTNSLRVILNDVESLPLIDYAKGEKNTKCGKKPKVGLFSAPEQRWPEGGVNHSHSSQLLYDEKVDIWKLPDVCNYILGNSSGSRLFKRYLRDKVHLQCKNDDPKLRPSAIQVLRIYKNIYNEFAS